MLYAIDEDECNTINAETANEEFDEEEFNEIDLSTNDDTVY